MKESDRFPTDDITWCWSDCVTDCPRQPKYIRDNSIPHSFADFSSQFCDLCKQGGNELNLDCDGCRKHWLQRDAVDFGGLLYWKRNTTFTADTPQTETQTETQNSNLTFEKDECAKEYEELGLKELKELIEADRKTEPNSSEKPNNSTISKMEQVDEPQTESTGSPIGDYRDGVGAWQTERIE